MSAEDPIYYYSPSSAASYESLSSVPSNYYATVAPLPPLSSYAGGDDTADMDIATSVATSSDTKLSTQPRRYEDAIFSNPSSTGVAVDVGQRRGNFADSDMNVLMMLAAAQKSQQCEKSSWASNKLLWVFIIIILIVLVVWIIVVLCTRNKGNCCKKCKKPQHQCCCSKKKKKTSSCSHHKPCDEDDHEEGEAEETHTINEVLSEEEEGDPETTPED
jgi:hypothetical protein